MHQRTIVMAALLTCSSVLMRPVACNAAELRDLAQTVAPVVDDMVAVVVHIDVTHIEARPLLAELQKLVAPALASLPPLQQVEMAVQRLTAAGCRDLYVVASLADLPEGTPFVAVPLEAGADAEPLAEALRSLKFEDATRIGGLLCGGSRKTLERLQHLQPAPRPELARAFEAAGDSVAQVLFIPSADMRRVLDELLPQLPAELGGATGAVWSRGAVWAALAVRRRPETSLQLTIQSEDAAAAATLHENLLRVAAALADQPGIEKLLPNLREHSRRLIPAVQKNRLALSLDQSHGGFDALAAILAPVISQATASSSRNQSADNLKQIGLALHSYHDMHKSLPPAASRSAAGRPLLSWRVHILPFLGQEELYREFHLDEAWDGPHNQALIARMPEVFRGPNSKVREPGSTPYLAATGEHAVFSGPSETELRQVTDGTSNTIMVVEVGDDRSVVWSQPADWELDPRKPKEGLGGRHSGGFFALFCDGSVRFLETSRDDKAIQALFTRDGGEPVGSN